jgi:hypothetical protein
MYKKIFLILMIFLTISFTGQAQIEEQTNIETESGGFEEDYKINYLNDSFSDKINRMFNSLFSITGAQKNIWIATDIDIGNFDGKPVIDLDNECYDYTGTQNDIDILSMFTNTDGNDIRVKIFKYNSFTDDYYLYYDTGNDDTSRSWTWAYFSVHLKDVKAGKYKVISYLDNNVYMNKKFSVEYSNEELNSVVPIITKVNFNDLNPSTYKNVNFYFYSEGQSSIPIKYHVDFGDGHEISGDITYSNGVRTSGWLGHTFKYPGDYITTITVFDKEGYFTSKEYEFKVSKAAPKIKTNSDFRNYIKGTVTVEYRDKPLETKVYLMKNRSSDYFEQDKIVDVQETDKDGKFNFTISDKGNGNYQVAVKENERLVTRYSKGYVCNNIDNENNEEDEDKDNKDGDDNNVNNIFNDIINYIKNSIESLINKISIK